MSEEKIAPSLRSTGRAGTLAPSVHEYSERHDRRATFQAHICAATITVAA